MTARIEQPGRLAPVVRLDGRRHYGALAEEREARRVRVRRWLSRHAKGIALVAGTVAALLLLAALVAVARVLAEAQR